LSRITAPGPKGSPKVTNSSSPARRPGRNAVLRSLGAKKRTKPSRAVSARAFRSLWRASHRLHVSNQSDRLCSQYSAALSQRCARLDCESARRTKRAARRTALRMRAPRPGAVGLRVPTPPRRGFVDRRHRAQTFPKPVEPDHARAGRTAAPLLFSCHNLRRPASSSLKAAMNRTSPAGWGARCFA
jgi:hypothetical protein